MPLTEDELKFYSPNQPRVAGLEREYRPQFDPAPNFDYRRFDNEIDPRRYIAMLKALPDIVWCNQMNTTGRWYIDLGQVEHATNEFIDKGRLALAQTGADAMLAEAVQAVLVDRANTLGVTGEEVTMCIRSSDDNQRKFWGGVHINLSMARSTFTELFEKYDSKPYANDHTKQLASYLIMSSIVLGSGTLRPLSEHKDERRFALHPYERLHAMTQIVSGTTTASRPIVNTRDEAHSPAQTHARLHIISLDAHTRPLSVALQVSALSAMIRTFEIGKPLRRWLVDPIGSLDDLNTNPHAEISVTDGQHISKIPAFEYAQEVYNQLVDLANDDGFPEDECEALQKIYDGLYDYLEGDTTGSDVTDVMPWLIKQQYLGSLGLLERGLTDAELEYLLAEHRRFDSYVIRPEKIVIGRHLQRVRTPKIMEAARKELMTPPEDTRAAERVRIIAKIPEGEDIKSEAGWDVVRWHTQQGDRQLYPKEKRLPLPRKPWPQSPATK